MNVGLCVAAATWVGSWVVATEAVAQTTRFSRADMAEVYLDIERAYRAHPPGEAAADINRMFDGATLKFFSGQRVIEALRGIGDRLRFGEEVTPNHAFASSLRVSTKPLVMSLDRPQSVVVKVEPMYDAQPVGALSVRIMAPSGKIVFDAAFTEPRAEFTVDAKKFSVGTHRVQVMSGEEPRFTSRLVVTERSLNEVREEMLAELGSVNVSPALAQALGACRARIALLTDTPSLEDSAQFQTDLTTLHEELPREVEALKAGRDPYANRRGDVWRTFTFHSMDIPCRVLAPMKGDGPFPLVLALHGAGGDENMWPDGYGAGELKALVEKHGFIAMSPRTELLIGNSLLFDSLIDSAASAYAIDRTRVYLIGHSLGAMASTGIASQRSGKVAAACLIGGLGRFPATSTMPPTLVISGELDPLMKAEQVEAGVAAAKKAGHPVELQMLKGRGHTLLVGEEMPRAIAWLLRRSSR